ncbi:peptidylprolyl isomerase [Pseudoroseomonas cervicalis]|uniref:peptidylprolyl isomerase n=1 Tax=Teichococcus cervicalis TaxID=204525 RepID=UPI0022F1B6B9|nr:peptidylprolyl isomerase [Pseudoroseomonas cervicalis]WBV41418.1 peptidyl-prolyl cis-trans isomerase [Pseudoroseomonas cervicalis]
MLTALRRLAGTWFAKILFVLLVLSFAVWGIEDIVRQFGSDNAVARVGRDAIEVPEAQAAARRETARVQRQLGGSFDITPQMSEALTRQAVEGLVMERVQRQEARQLGLAVPEAAVREYVWGIPAFQGPDGRFNRLAFDSFLRNNQLSEAEFLTLLRGELERLQMVGAVRSGAAGPDALTRPLLAWEREQRVAEIVRLPFSAAPEPAAPEEAQLRRFHENNADRFSAPEYRRVTLAVLSPETVMGDVQATEEELRAAYEAHRDHYERPERRTLQQALLPDREKAEALARQWREGADFAAITQAAEAAGGQATELGESDRAGLPLPELAEAAFALPQGGVSEPVQSPFGWHVVHVTAIAAGEDRGFEAVRPEVEAQVKRERAADLAYERANQVEDALAAGGSLAEVAPRFGLSLVQAVVDASGRTQDGSQATLPLSGQGRDVALRAIFAAEQGQMPRLAEAGQTALFAFELQEVIPAALRPFESVEPQVRAAYLADARRRAQEERAAALLAAARGGKSLAEAAQEAGLSAQRVGPLARDAQQPGLPGEVVQAIFAAAPNEATMAETRDAFVVAQVMQVVPFDPASDPLALGRVRGTVEQAMLADLEAQYLDALRRGAEVRYNEEALRQLRPAN